MKLLAPKPEVPRKAGFRVVLPVPQDDILAIFCSAVHGAGFTLRLALLLVV